MLASHLTRSMRFLKRKTGRLSGSISLNQGYVSDPSLMSDVYYDNIYWNQTLWRYFIKG
jgi:hypothetical protein